MLQAISAMRRSSQKHAMDPLVGAVLACNGRVVSAQEHTLDGHAEYLLLTNAETQVPPDATLYTTLEPCTFRGVDRDGKPKVSCTDLIVAKRIRRVVIGMLDPNPYILGNGVLRLRERGVEVGFFPPELMAEVEQANLAFRRVFGLGQGTTEAEELPEIRGKWLATTTFEDGRVTSEEVYLQRRIGNRFYGVMFNVDLGQKYNFFMVEVAPRVWDYAFRSKLQAQELDHGAGVICFDTDDRARAIGVAHGAFAGAGQIGIRASVELERIASWQDYGEEGGGSRQPGG